MASKRFEGSAADNKADKKMAKKMKMSMKKFENSAADKKMDKAGQAKLNKKK